MTMVKDPSIARSLIEAVYLSEEELEESPPCEILVGGLTPCGAAATARIRKHCQCGRKTFFFICAPHLEMMRDGEINCHWCGKMHDASDWTIA